MDLKTYLSDLSMEGRDMFARKCGTTRGHLQNVVYGHRALSAELAVRIERESGGKVTRIEMFPDNFRDKWPELAKA